MSRPLRFALIGTSRIGQVHAASVLQANPHETALRTSLGTTSRKIEAG
jgi:predicted dehydrogenase